MTTEPERRIKLLKDVTSIHPKPIVHAAKGTEHTPILNEHGIVQIEVEGVKWRLQLTDFQWLPLPGVKAEDLLAQLNEHLNEGIPQRPRYITTSSLLHTRIKEALGAAEKK